MEYRIAFPTKARPRSCPVEGCSGQAVTQTDMRIHFWNRHILDTVLILDEGNLSHITCPLCDMMFPWRSLNRQHQHKSQCKKGAERKRSWLTSYEERSVTSRSFSSYGSPLEMVTSYRYLWRLISAVDDDWPAVIWNLVKV